MNSEFYDVVIVGCGPAGLSALLWASELRIRAVAFESAAEPGGQLLWTFNRIENHLGTVCNDGKSMRDLFLDQLENRYPDIRPGIRIEEINHKAKKVTLSDKNDLCYGALIIATGVRRRKLGVSGESDFGGKGILESGKKEAGKAKGKNAVVVGGGDAAFENALILCKYASQVTLLHRRNEFTARSEFVKAAREKENIKIITDCIVSGFEGSETLETVNFVESGSGREFTQNAEIAVIRIGVVPNSEFLKEICETDSRGFIEVDASGLTSIVDIYAIGDVANPTSPTISTAVGTAATAIKTIGQIL